VAIGTMVNPSMKAASLLESEGLHATVLNARFAKPLDTKAILSAANACGAIVTVEESVVLGGFGASVLEALSSNGIAIPTRVLGVPDCIFEQAPQQRLRDLAGLSADAIGAAARDVSRMRKPDSPELLLAGIQ
jgi:1-deoxy-D-xylulose-5-phosphate synthase